MKVLDFKTVSPFYEQTREGIKPFDIRKVEAEDERFTFLEWWYRNRRKAVIIRLTNPATGESFCRQLVGLRRLPGAHGTWGMDNILMPPWLILYLGDKVKLI
jgi:hypothetical protein